MNIATYKGDIKRAAAAEAALCVDLDGTLIRTDMLHEAIFMLLRMNPLYLLMLPFWLIKGKAHLKAEIAARVSPDVEALPYNQKLIAWLKVQRARGREVILATASHRTYAEAIAGHLKIFDGIEASDTVNLSGSAKAQRLVKRYGEKQFDYVGNGAADIPVWNVSRQAVIVGTERAALEYASRSHAVRFDTKEPYRSRLGLWVKAIRIHQWLKNTLLFVPAILAFQYFETATVVQLGIAFLSFSLCASSVYLLNDLTDMEVDRKHKTKHTRPIPSGMISVPDAILVSIVFQFCAFGFSLALPPAFTLVLAIYFCTTCAYSFFLKRLLLIDVLTLAGLFTIRVFAGSAAVGGVVSTWLLAFCVFFFLSLALVKRFVEVSNQLENAGRKETGRGYQAADLETLGQGGLASGFAAVVVLALFIDSPQIAENYHRPEFIWLVCPLILYLIFRIWILARRQEMHDDPVVFLMKDWRSQLMIGAGAVLMLVSQMV